MEKLNQNKEVTKTEESHNIFDDKSIVLNEETWTVTLPEKKLANLREALAYTRKQEKAIISKLRESNEYIINEVKEMLKNAFNWWYHSDKIREWWYKYSDVCSDDDYKSAKLNYTEKPIKFLSEYEGNLQNFMDLVAEELKSREYWWWNSLYIMCNRFWITVEEFKNMDTISIIEMVKKDIKNIPSLNPSTCANDMREHLWAANFYYYAITDACKKLWYKL